MVLSFDEGGGGEGGGESVVYKRESVWEAYKLEIHSCILNHKHEVHPCWHLLEGWLMCCIPTVRSVWGRRF